MLRRLQHLSAFPLNCLWWPATEGRSEKAQGWPATHREPLETKVSDPCLLPAALPHFALRQHCVPASSWAHAETRYCREHAQGQFRRCLSVQSPLEIALNVAQLLDEALVGHSSGGKRGIQSLFPASLQLFPDGAALCPFGHITHWFICNKHLLHTYGNSYFLPQECSEAATNQ